ncbi:MAG TPA: exonuclease domain-containing protein [Candidatus Binatia bacterium]|nr:exonuclease domain-containing protein [Candidatus Binatia bacterium]
MRRSVAGHLGIDGGGPAAGPPRPSARFWSSERRLLLGLLLFFGLPTALALAALVVLHQRGAFAEPNTLLVAVLVGLPLLMAVLALLAEGAGRTLVRRVAEMRRGTEVMATVDPARRLDVGGGGELGALAGEINRLADRLDEARTGHEAAVARATAALALERGKLSAILDDLDEGVILASTDGVVTLANARARELLGSATAGMLGQKLFDFVDEGRICHFVERLRAGGHSAERFSLDSPGGRMLRVSMTPYRDGPGALVGFVLSMREGDQARGDGDGPVAAGEVDVGRLLSAAREHVRRGGARTVIEISAPPGLRVRAEAAALSAALAHSLRGLLAQGRADGGAWLEARPHGRLIEIDAGAMGAAPIAAIEDLLDAPAGAGGGDRWTVRHVVRRHAGEAWAVADGMRVMIRINLPAAGPETEGAGEGGAAALAGAGLRSGAAGAAAVPPRPDLYDFSFLDLVERHVSTADRERSLLETPCVAFDTETTGLRPDSGDRIVSLAGVRIRQGQPRAGEIFDALVNPGRPVPAAAVAIHGITGAMLADAPPIRVVLPAFVRFAAGSVLVGHDVWFDLRFLETAGTALGLPALAATSPVLDTRLLSEFAHPSASDHGLDALAARVGVPLRGRHSALGDALITAEVFARLLVLLDRRGVRTLGEALDVARQGRSGRAGQRRP